VIWVNLPIFPERTGGPPPPSSNEPDVGVETPRSNLDRAMGPGSRPQKTPDEPEDGGNGWSVARLARPRTNRNPPFSPNEPENRRSGEDGMR
jgi:hypothetical protein